MNRILIPVVITLVAIVGFFVGTIASSSRAQSVAGQQWEYFIVDSNGLFLQYDTAQGDFIDVYGDEEFRSKFPELDENLPDSMYRGRYMAVLGDYGWEFVGTIEGDQIYKRPKP